MPKQKNFVVLSNRQKNRRLATRRELDGARDAEASVLASGSRGPVEDPAEHLQGQFDEFLTTSQGDDSSNDAPVLGQYSIITGCSCQREQKKIMRKLDEILEILGDLTSGRVNRTVKNQEIEDFSDLPEFPLDTHEQVEAFELQLRENVDNIRQKYKAKIQTLGGATIEIAVRNALKTVLTDELAIYYSWTGQKKTIKISEFLLITEMIDIIMCTQSGTLNDIRNAIMNWLRHAGDRVRYRQKKRSLPE